jgi:activator of HSP90 ATPase
MNVAENATTGPEPESNPKAATETKIFSLSRRRALGWGAVASVGFVAGGMKAAVSQASGAQAVGGAMKAVPASAANKDKTALHLSATITASSQRIYEALLDAKIFAAFSGLPAVIDSQAGGAFSLFSGQITGRNVELRPAERIVQAWRPGHWEPGVYSIVRFDFVPAGAGTTLEIDHKGFPAGDFDGLLSGWQEHYAEPLKKYFARS